MKNSVTENGKYIPGLPLLRLENAPQSFWLLHSWLPQMYEMPKSGFVFIFGIIGKMLEKLVGAILKNVNCARKNTYKLLYSRFNDESCCNSIIIERTTSSINLREVPSAKNKITLRRISKLNFFVFLSSSRRLWGIFCLFFFVICALANFTTRYFRATLGIFINPHETSVTLGGGLLVHNKRVYIVNFLL